jgi:hypothetical protein
MQAISSCATSTLVRYIGLIALKSVSSGEVKIGMTIARAVDVPCNCSFAAGIDSIACLDPREAVQDAFSISMVLQESG